MVSNRVVKKGSTEAVNGIGLSRRRHRITALRDSPEEEGPMDLQETVRPRERERMHKVERVGDRDQELVNQRKKRRIERSKHRNVEGGGAEGSSGPSGGETYEEDDDEPSSSMSNHALRRLVTPTRNFRSISGLRIADEMIGAAVPRKARSASVKRLNEQWKSSSWGFLERQSRRKLSPSPLAGNVNIVSPPSSSLSLRRKMKPLGSKGLISKVSRKHLPSVENDIEIEVIEALFDLMKQSQSQLQSRNSKNDETTRDSISAENLDSVGNKDSHTKPLCSPAVSARISPETSDLPLDINSSLTASLDVELSTEKDLKSGRISSGAPEGTGEISLAKGKDSSDSVQESAGGDQVAKEKASISCAKSDVDGSTGSTVSKANLASEVVKPERVANIETDLMAPSALSLSPGRDCPNSMMPELKLDLEKPEPENVSYKNSQQWGQKEPNHCIVSERQNFGQSNSSPSPNVATDSPGRFPQPGYIPRKTLLPVDKSLRTTASLLAPFTLTQPWPKKCVTHKYIACNIRHHQQLTKNCMQPAATSVTLLESKFPNGNPTTSISNSFLGFPMQGDLPGRHALAAPVSPSVSCMKGRSSDIPNAVDSIETKKLVLQSDQIPGGNLSHQAANMPKQQPGSDTSTGEAALSNKSAGGLALGSFPLPTGAAAVSLNFSNLPVSDTPPFMAILQGNGHPYSISTNSGMPLPIKGDQIPVLPLLNASYHPSMFCMPQNQEKQSACQPQSNHLHQVLQASHTSGASSSSISSHKQSKSQQQIVAHINNRNSFSSEGLQLQQSQNQYVLGLHSSGKSVDSPGSHVHKVGNGRNYGSPFQTMNFSSVSPGDRNQQQPGTEHRVAVVPSQVIGFSFDSNAPTRAINFSALPQDPAVVQMLSDVGQLGYQFVPLAQVAQNKSFQLSEKNVVSSNNADDGKKVFSAKSVDQSAIMQVALSDGSIQTWSSLSPPTAGNQSFSSPSAAAAAAFSITLPSSQQQQLQKEIQLQKKHIQQMQLTGTAQIQTPISDNFHYSSIGCNYPNKNPVFSFVPNNNFYQSSQWKNSSIATTSQVSPLATPSSLKILPQQQSRNSQDQHHISFGSSLNSATLYQDQRFLINSPLTSSWQSSNSSASTYIWGSGSLKTTFRSSKDDSAVAEIPSQQTEVSNKSSQKSIPACGRDVPSILSKCSSQLPELKY